MAEITRLGETYEAGWGLAQQSYQASTPLVKKILDELTLKQRFTLQFDRVLSPEQQAAVFDPQTRHVFPLDVVSPGLLLMGRARPVAKKTVDELKAAAADVLSSAWGVSAEDLTALPGALDGWAQQLAPLLAKPHPASTAGFFRVDEAILACQAHLALYQKTLTLAATEETRIAMRSAFVIVIPHLLQPAR